LAIFLLDQTTIAHMLGLLQSVYRVDWLHLITFPPVEDTLPD